MDSSSEFSLLLSPNTSHARMWRKKSTNVKLEAAIQWALKKISVGLSVNLLLFAVIIYPPHPVKDKGTIYAKI